MTAETNEMANDGWWPDDDHAPVTQLYRMRGANVVQIVNCGVGWRAFNMVGMTLASPNPFVSDSREQAKTICEEYAKALYRDADAK